MYCELTLYDTPSKLTMQVRDREEAEKIVAVVHEIMLGDDEYHSRYQYKEQWGHGKHESPFRTLKNVTIDDVKPTRTPYGG
jgi:hypothetical protein